MSTTITTTPDPPAPPAASKRASPYKLKWLDEIGRVTVGSVVMLAFLITSMLSFFRVVPDGPIIEKVQELLDTLVTMVVFFYYGSSSGSKAKETQIAEQPPAAAPALASTTIVTGTGKP